MRISYARFILCAALAATPLLWTVSAAPAKDSVKKTAPAEKNVWSIRVSQTKKEALYAPGEKFSFRANLLFNGKPAAGKIIRWTLANEERKPSVSGAYRIPENGEDLVIPCAISKPGFVRLELSAWDTNNKKQIMVKNKNGHLRRVEGLAGAGCEPFKIKSGIAEPADFDTFWNARRAELAKKPVKAERRIVKIGNEWLQNHANLYDVEIACPGKNVTGYLGISKNAKPKSLPIVLSVHGAGTRSSGVPWLCGGYQVIAMDINAHGIPNGKEESYYKNLAKGPLKDYWYIGNADRNKNYFLGMYMRLMRALQYLKTLPEWDGKHIVVTGGSQGGAQALAAAGLDKDVTYCIAVVPWLCNFTGVLSGRIPPYWPTWIPMKNGREVNPALAKELPYFDSALFAKRIGCETVVTVGYIDYGACPPSGVYTAFNNIPHKRKTIRPFPEGGHGGTNVNGVLDSYLKRIGTKKIN